MNTALTYTEKEVISMPLTKIKEKYQVTIPAVIRQLLGLKIGDVLEAEVKDNVIVLRPKAIIDKAAAWNKLVNILGKDRERSQALSDEEVMEDVLAAIQEVRQKKHAARRR
jgi:AbrB family looped-hinge helix DNA binding protein